MAQPEQEEAGQASRPDKEVSLEALIAQAPHLPQGEAGAGEGAREGARVAGRPRPRETLDAREEDVDILGEEVPPFPAATASAPRSLRGRHLRPLSPEDGPECLVRRDVREHREPASGPPSARQEAAAPLRRHSHHLAEGHRQKRQAAAPGAEVQREQQTKARAGGLSVVEAESRIEAERPLFFAKVQEVRSPQKV